MTRCGINRNNRLAQQQMRRWRIFAFASNNRLVRAVSCWKRRLRRRSPDAEPMRFAAAVEGFGKLLRGGRYTENFGFNDVLALVRAAKDRDHQGHRSEFIQLVCLAQSLTPAITEPTLGLAVR